MQPADARAAALFREGTAELRGGMSVSKAIKALTAAHELAPDDVEIAGALWEAEKELATVLHEMAKHQQAEGNAAEAERSEMRANLADQRAAKLDEMSAHSLWRTSPRTTVEATAESDAELKGLKRLLVDVQSAGHLVTAFSWLRGACCYAPR
ncbi:hypothetical protein AB1Y20_006406 [Prymnesium parvum]|uniref:Uncharacterized protein n=1 Tax=Prymnesium parvum TaxID=97485 RepID=A0AB34J5S9_PRYPA